MTRSDHELRVLLPWYVNGTLDPATRNAVELRLLRSPDWRSEVLWLTLLRSQIRDLTLGECSPRAAEAGLDTLMALIQGEASRKIIPMRKSAWAWVGATRRLPLSVGIAAALVLSQAVIIGALLNKPTPDALTPMSGGGPLAGGHMLQITFKPLATEGEIRALLSGVQGEIVAGPGALGVYTVRVPDQQEQQALQRLRSDASVIDSVVLLPSR